MVGAKPAGAAEHAAVAVDRQHDDDRIGARKMLRSCRTGNRAASRPATTWVGAPQFGAEAVARMPAEQRLGLGERRQMIGVDQALHRDRAQVGDVAGRCAP